MKDMKWLEKLEKMLGELSDQFNFCVSWPLLCFTCILNTLRYVQWLEWRESLYYWSVERGGEVCLLLFIVMPQTIVK